MYFEVVYEGILISPSNPDKSGRETRGRIKWLRGGVEYFFMSRENGPVNLGRKEPFGEVVMATGTGTGEGGFSTIASLYLCKSI